MDAPAPVRYRRCHAINVFLKKFESGSVRDPHWTMRTGDTFSECPKACVRSSLVCLG